MCTYRSIIMVSCRTFSLLRALVSIIPAWISFILSFCQSYWLCSGLGSQIYSEAIFFITYEHTPPWKYWEKWSGVVSRALMLSFSYQRINNRIKQLWIKHKKKEILFSLQIQRAICSGYCWSPFLVRLVKVK